MQINKVCVFGGSGFVGRHLVALLAARGCEVLVPTRHAERARDMLVLPTVEVVGANVHDASVLHELLAGCDAAVNLVGILHGSRDEFARIHVELPRKIAAACHAQGVPRLLHMSALNADAGSRSGYLRSKGEGEAVIRASGLQFSIFRPSVIFGRGDHFINRFAALLGRLPLLPLACPGTRFQPVWVEDVARVFAASLPRADAIGQSYDLCGPQVYTLRQVVEYVRDMAGRHALIVGLGNRLSYLQAWLFEHFPGKLLTRDDYYAMQVDSICRCAFPFGMVPAPLAAVACLADDLPLRHYFHYGAGN